MTFDQHFTKTKSDNWSTIEPIRMSRVQSVATLPRRLAHTSARRAPRDRRMTRLENADERGIA